MPWPKEGVSDFAQSPGRATCVTSPRLAGAPLTRERNRPSALPWRVLCPAGRRAASLDVRPVGHKTKLMPKDQWSTILGHSPDVADALIQSMLLAA